MVFEELIQNPDIGIWKYAKEMGFTIVTADVDFYELSITFGAPPTFHAVGHPLPGGRLPG